MSHNIIRRLLCTYFPVAWIGHFSIGLTYGFMGPAQPYLARYIHFDHLVFSKDNMVKIYKMRVKLRSIIFMFYRQVGVDHQTISTMYSVRAAGTVASSLLVGYLFGSVFFTQKPGEGGCRKLALLSISQTIIAASLLAVPFVKSFPVLLTGKLL